MRASFRLALLASCFAMPAWAQEVPALQDTAPPAAALSGAGARAKVDVQAQQASAQATAMLNSSLEQQRHMQESQAQMEAQRRAQQAAASNGQAAVPPTMPPKADPVSANKPLSKKEWAGVAVARSWINKYQKPRLDSDGTERFDSCHGQISIVAAVDHVTDIALTPGEIIQPPLQVGDSADWISHPVAAHVNGKLVSHVIVKPKDAGLRSNIVIQTNKRTLLVELVSRRSEYMPLIAIDTCDDQQDGSGAAYWASYNAQTGAGGGRSSGSPCDLPPTVPPDQFKIEGDNVSWRPLQAYQVSTPNAGIKTCVEFPSNIGSLKLPALLALANDGGIFTSPTKTMVSYRYLDRRFVVDGDEPRLILVDGVGDQQQAIRITRKRP